MADWAEEMARYDIWRSTEDIAAALRKVRADALKEAEEIARVFSVAPGLTTNEHMTAFRIASAIGDIKGKKKHG